MTLHISQLAADITPEKTILLFGSGASLPSHAPSANDLTDHLSSVFRIPREMFTLGEMASLVEEKQSRAELIRDVRSLFRGINPTGGLLNLPLFQWRSLFTTNYDDLIEQSYKRKCQELLVYTSNFDFTIHDKPDTTKLFKIHGTIDKDISDGHQSRIIITDSDYDHTEDYREQIYDRLKSDLAEGHLIIIGNSLADPDIKAIAERAVRINTSSGGGGRVTLLLYQQDENRASLYAKRGISVCFGGIDDFFAELSKQLPETRLVYKSSVNQLELHPVLIPVTIDVTHDAQKEPNVSGMFNGWPASSADIQSGLTFERTLTIDIERDLVTGPYICALVLGASGVGKTTAARQVLYRLKNSGYLCWEHNNDYQIPVKYWVEMAKQLEENKLPAVLFVDEAHSHLQQINDLLDSISCWKQLRLILVSSRNHWYPRVKTPIFFKVSKEYKMSRLDADEIDKLLNLVDHNSSIRNLVEETFSGFSRYERRRRLVDRCEADMFVCLKNIFASEKFDDIILREYASLDSQYQEIYRLVAAMESAGIRVHRQLVIRLLGIPAVTIAAVLSNLTDIVSEYTVSEKEGIYGWKGRHSVIVDIVTKYKFAESSQIIELFNKVIDCISPTYDIEVRTIRELCNVDSGIKRIPNKQTQNTLLRKMMSIAPGERVPRHRLIRNLIEMGEFEKAETEIRIFEKDLGADGPVARYKVMLLKERAAKSPGILHEDRVVILGKARDLAVASISRFPFNKNVLYALCEVGIEWYKLTKDFSNFDLAIREMKVAEERIGDPEISKMIARYERIMNGHYIDQSNDFAESEGRTEGSALES
jgi:hypothetical protein